VGTGAGDGSTVTYTTAQSVSVSMALALAFPYVTGDALTVLTGVGVVVSIGAEVIGAVEEYSDDDDGTATTVLRDVAGTAEADVDAAGVPASLSYGPRPNHIRSCVPLIGTV